MLGLWSVHAFFNLLGRPVEILLPAHPQEVYRRRRRVGHKGTKRIHCWNGGYVDSSQPFISELMFQVLTYLLKDIYVEWFFLNYDTNLYIMLSITCCIS